MRVRRNSFFNPQTLERLAAEAREFHSQLAWYSFDNRHPLPGCDVLVRMRDGRVVGGWYYATTGQWGHSTFDTWGQPVEWAHKAPAQSASKQSSAELGVNSTLR